VSQNPVLPDDPHDAFVELLSRDCPDLLIPSSDLPIEPRPLALGHSTTRFKGRLLPEGEEVRRPHAHLS
jgi:hypothetical protein